MPPFSGNTLTYPFRVSGCTKKTQIETLLEGYIPDLVMAATAEEYQQVKEQVIEECKAMGSDELFTWSKEAYDNAYKAFTDAKAK